MSRRTKILATLGPASESPEVIRGMIRAGMDAVRLNLSHGSVDGAVELHRRVRAIAAEEGREIGTLVDLPGPKVRAASFGRDGVDGAAGDVVRFEQGATASTRDVVRVAAEGVVDGLQPGDRVSFGDGGIVATVVEVAGGVVAHVIHGGHLSGSPGVHVPAERLKINTPTPEDLRILDRFVEEGVDMIAVSFVRSAHDIRRLGTEPHPRGPLVVAKIETHAAVENLAGILDVTGAVMIARGDLGIEFPIEEVPHLQKEIVRACIGRGCPAITATQMLESMVHAPTPTRAEATDVANAVFDGTSVVMLSGETAVGDDPVNVVATMSRLCQKADEAFDAVLRAAAQRGLSIAAMKAVETGCRREADQLVPADALHLRAACWPSSPPPIELVCPHRFEPPVAPSVAARAAGERIDLERIDRAHATLAGSDPDLLLVEGAGGLLVPLEPQDRE